ncbi:hypothetical protein DTL42_19185 [Bremerella cremea]|uniref:Uncharacterized protein n=1 Tax=Bremerella cremea TaxID=1031537 RepID=A0A368KMH8_9BACT|nr:hypothetical protein DTL42_19185 [Bremerella cremea]
MENTWPIQLFHGDKFSPPQWKKMAVLKFSRLRVPRVSCPGLATVSIPRSLRLVEEVVHGIPRSRRQSNSWLLVAGKPYPRNPRHRPEAPWHTERFPWQPVPPAVEILPATVRKSWAIAFLSQGEDEINEGIRAMDQQHADWFMEELRKQEEYRNSPQCKNDEYERNRKCCVPWRGGLLEVRLIVTAMSPSMKPCS